MDNNFEFMEPLSEYLSDAMTYSEDCNEVMEELPLVLTMRNELPNLDSQNIYEMKDNNPFVPHCKLLIKNFEDTKRTQYVKHKKPDNYKEFQLSIPDMNIKDDATIEMLLLYANTKKPVTIDGKAINVSLVAEDNTVFRNTSKGIKLEYFKIDSGLYLVKQSIPSSQKYSGKKYQTRILITTESEVLTCDSDEYYIKTRCKPTGKSAKQKRVVSKILASVRTLFQPVVMKMSEDEMENLSEYFSEPTIVQAHLTLQSNVKRARESKNSDNQMVLCAQTPLKAARKSAK